MGDGQPIRNRCGGLSLVEVLVAIGVFAVAVVSVVALFGPAVRDTREVADRRTAQRLGEAIDAELQRAGFATVTAVADGGGSLVLVARADGAQVVQLVDADNDPRTGIPPGIPATERYFAVEASGVDGPLSSPSCTVLEVRVSWPAVLPPEGTETAMSRRSNYVFHTAINR